MPRYVYKCSNCKYKFEVVHSMKDKLVDCPECDEEEVLDRLPSSVNISVSEIDNSNQKTGEMTKEYIEDNRESLKSEKTKLKDRVWK